MIRDDHLGMQAAEVYADACGEGAALGGLNAMLNDPDVMTARRAMALHKAERLKAAVQQFERRVIDPGGLEMRHECVIPLDMFLSKLLHGESEDEEPFWDNDSNMTDYMKWNRDLCFPEPVRKNFTGWRGRAERTRDSSALVVGTDHRGHVREEVAA